MCSGVGRGGDWVGAGGAEAIFSGSAGRAGAEPGGPLGSGRRLTSFNCRGPDRDEEELIGAGLDLEFKLELEALGLPWTLTFSTACVRRSITASSSGLVS